MNLNAIVTSSVTWGGEPSSEIPIIPLLPEDMVWAENELQSLGGNRPILILGIGSSTPRRTWPVERFIDVAAAFPEWDCLLVGSGADGKVGETVLRPILKERLKNYAGKCSLSRSAALASLATLSIGNNSAVMHLAACADVPVVDICGHPDGGDKFHDQSPIRFTAQYTRHVVVTPMRAADPTCASGCVSNREHCIAVIPAKEVIAAARWLLREVRNSHQHSDWYPLTLWSELRKAENSPASSLEITEAQ